jgi:hypothetical protein
LTTTATLLPSRDKSNSLTIRITLALPLLALTTCFAAQAQSKNIFTNYEHRVNVTSAEQPAWPVPVVAPSSGIVQLARFDFVRQYTSAHTLTETYGNGKGFNFIPFYRTEVDVNLPPLIEHNNQKVVDGAGDFSMALKYRLSSGNDKHHNYSISAQVQGVGTTGSYKNGTLRNQINPTVIAGKGFGRFDIQSSIGGVLPVGSIHTVGRSIVWNTVGQYKASHLLWPEIEVNSTFYHLGPNDGKNQTFVTPGMMTSMIPLGREKSNRLALIFGAGMQIATSSFHAYNHALVITSRITF